jgi:hypothetical protein
MKSRMKKERNNKKNSRFFLFLISLFHYAPSTKVLSTKI